METTRNIILLLLVVLALPACTSQGPDRPLAAEPPIYPQAVFAHRVSSPEVDIYWNCTGPESGFLRVNGVGQSTGGREVRFLEIKLEGVDAKDRSVSKAATAVPDIVLHTNQISPFQLELRTVGTEVRFDLFYQYTLGMRLSKQDIFMARDVCSETQHRLTNMGG